MSTEFKKKPLQSLYMTISDDDLIRVIDMMKFDTGDTEIWVRKYNRLRRSNIRLRPPWAVTKQHERENLLSILWRFRSSMEPNPWGGPANREVP